MSKKPIPGTLLGDGKDLTGRLVQYWGGVWTITGKNYLGDWEVRRQEQREYGSVWAVCSIDSKVLDERHPHYAELLPVN